MRKQSKRRIRAASEPALVRLATNPEIGIAENMAITAMKCGFATYENSYRILADCHGMLMIGARRKYDRSMDGVIEVSRIALFNIYDRAMKTKRYGATGDELIALTQLVEVANDFWKRQSSAALEIAIAALRRVREMQIAENKAKKAA